MKNNENEINVRLAAACQKTCASCCCKGDLFLPPEELEDIRSWIEEKSPEDREKFEGRLSHYDSFSLYAQGDRCQFLSDENLCRLHEDKVKPSECYWWPLHVYTNVDKELEVRVSISCCDAYRHITPESSLLDDIENTVNALGREIFYDFRKVYSGSYDNKFLKKL